MSGYHTVHIMNDISNISIVWFDRNNMMPKTIRISGGCFRRTSTVIQTNTSTIKI